MAPTDDAPDVLVLGEVLLEVSTAQAPADGIPARLGFSGDALNVAAAAAAAGARTALVARIPDDDLGDAVVARIAELGVSTAYLVRGLGQHGVYISHADPEGARQFSYVRRGSFGSTLAPDDLDSRVLAAAAVVTASGIAVALSDSAAATVEYAAHHATRFVYDPNFRPRLTTREVAAARFATLAPLAAVVKPSHPGETTALLGVAPDATDEQLLNAAYALGAHGVVVTRGARGALVGDAGRGTAVEVPVIPAARVVDQTGAGDCLTGTMCARLALGEDLVTAVWHGSAAASLSVGGQGGTGCVPALEQTQDHLAAYRAALGKQA